jgi:hypothetical protein
VGGFCQQFLKLGNHPAPLIKLFLEKHLQMNAYTGCLQLKFYSKLVLHCCCRSWCGEIIQSSKGRFWYVKSTTSKDPVVPAKTRRVKNHHHHHHADDLSFELQSSNTVFYRSQS